MLHAAKDELESRSFDRNLFKVESSPQDDRFYRIIQLPTNCLTCLLISDPTTDKSSAAMDVGVGHLSDPDVAPGLAHFLEHMLFLGTEKYPDENEYNVYLASHGGHSNAYTDMESTNYYFDVSADFLDGALDRFAQFFISPLFTQESTEREMQAVDSEHAKNLQSDYWRMFQLYKSLCRKDHPFCKFGTGNLATLGIEPKESGLNIRTLLLDFHDKFYSANLMKLVVLGKESLDELENMTNKHFALVPNKNAVRPVFPGKPYSPEFLCKRLSVVPVRDAVRTVDLTFPLREINSLYRVKPTRYLSHLLGHEGKGSILSSLKREGWATELTAGEGRSCSDWSSFSVSIDLTESGLENVDRVVDIVFAYISLLKVKGIQHWIHEETATVASCNFRFLSKRNPCDYTSSVASNMQIYPPEHVLSGPYLLYEYDADLIEEFMHELNPNNMILAVSSKSFVGKTELQEQIYGTQYNSENIQDELCDRWKTVTISDELAKGLDLPEKNEMIPSDFSIFRLQDAPVDTPRILLDSERCRLWYKPDNVFDMPKVNVMVMLHTHVVAESPEAAVLAMLWVEIIQDHLNEFSYLAAMAGLHCSISETRQGIQLSLSGYSEKAHVLFKRLIETMRASPERINQDLFYRVKDVVRKKLMNFVFAQPYQHASYVADIALEYGKWTTQETISASDQISIPDLQAFAYRVMSRFFLEVLVHGNVSPNEAEANFALVTLSGLNPRNPFLTTMSEPRVVELGKGKEYVVRFKEPNVNNTNSCVEIIYQFGPMELHANAVLSFLNHLMNEPAFDELRTKEQLGYIVHTSVKTNGNNIKGLLFLIQSDSFDPIYLSSRIDAFIDRFRAKIVAMPPDEFQSNVEAVVANFLEKNKNLSQESTKYWQVITDQSYFFTKWQKIAACVKCITPEEVLRFFDKYIANYGPNMKKLCIQVFAQKHLTVFNNPVGDQVELLFEHDLTSFRRSMPLYHLPKPVSLTPWMTETTPFSVQ